MVDHAIGSGHGGRRHAGGGQAHEAAARRPDRGKTDMSKTVTHAALRRIRRRATA